ncbi:phosphatidylinositol kinase-related protein kinase [Starmerella bacillaris]|uniref:Serine/threonine-protein kinase TOR n=1 Tax=Starmerella bacillaris TaxID=1247836 RepID=A0AAV5RLF3_STABA|nr:phosphatidylinositol kinase-related protein kinase [Starmerella bacillaris]
MSSESILSSIFSALRSNERSRKLEGARELKEAVVACSRESPRSSLRLNQEANKLIFELIRSPDSSLRLGGVLAIDQLVPMDLAGEDSGFNATRFMHYLRQVLLTPDIEVIRAAASAIGHLARSGGTLAGELVEYEVKRCCEWLTLERQETKRLAAAVELKALAVNAPTLMFAYINIVVDALWSGIRDPKLAIRQDSVGALGVCLQIVNRRDAAIQESVYTGVWLEACTLDGQNASNEQIHGSLLVFRELLSNAGRFMDGPRYKEALKIVLTYKDHKDALIRRTVVDVLPSFAQFSPQLFASNYLKDTMVYLQQQLQTAKPSDRALVFVALGRIALAVRVSMAPYVDPVINAARETLANAKARVRHEQEPGIFRCLGLFAQALGQALTKYVDRSFLRLLFSCGLTRQLYECLASLYENLPALQDEIRDLLLNVVAQGLSGYPYHMPGQPDEEDEDEDASKRQINTALAKEYRQQMLQKIGAEALDGADEDAVISFMRILAEFDFKGRSLAHFCKSCVLSYVASSDARVRKAAALTCIAVFTREPVAKEHSRLAVNTVQTVLHELLALAAADPHQDIRLDILKALDSRLDAHLSQPESVRVLLICTNDESFAVRLVSIGILGRLCQVNPAYVAPPLRRSMIELLTDLEYSTNSRGREESARLLGALVRAAQSLTQPYIDPLFTVVLDAASATTPAVSSAAMDAAGELCVVGGLRSRQHAGTLMPLVLTMLSDQGSASRRDSALRTLGKLAVHAEYVIKPYFEYPLLLPTLVRILTTETPLATRRETVKLLGTLGALDPYRYREIERESESVDDDDGLEGQQHQHVPEDVKLVLRGTPPSAEEYNPTVVIRSLMALLRDPAMAANHTRVVQAVLRIFESLGLRCVLFLNDVIPGLIAAMRTNSLAMADLLFRQISALTAVVRQHIRPSLPVLFPVVTEYFQYPELHGAVLSLVEALANALGRDFRTCVPTILPRLIAVLQSDDGDNAQLAASKVRVLHALPVLGPCLSEYAHLVFPNVVNLFSFEPDQVRNAAFRCVSLLVQAVKLGPLASRVVLPLVRSLAVAGNDEARAAALQTLCDVCFQLGSEFALFVPTASSTINRLRQHAHHVASTNLNVSANGNGNGNGNGDGYSEQGGLAIAPLLAVYDRLVSRVLRNEPLTPDMNPALKQLSKTAPPPPPEQKSTLAINPEFLRHAWATTGRSTNDDWTEWFRRISVEFLKQSPSPAMRACADIAVISPTLSRDLFSPSFYTVWAQLDDILKADLVDNVHAAMAAPNVPPDVLQTLLTLAEFMERDDKPLSLPPKVMADYAEKCHAYAKALHYKEQEFMADPSSSNIESLIAINNQLQQSDAAVGILKHAQQHHVLQLKESWYEKLQRWEEALAAYSVRERLEPENSEVFLGKMRSLHALGEWEQLSALARDKWGSGTPEVRKLVAPLAAAAAWGLNEWEEMNKYVIQIGKESPDRSFFSAVLSVHRGDIEEAEKQVCKARDQLLPELSALVSESYSRAYGVCVRVQMLSELEEVMAYMKLGDFAEAERESLRRTWEQRLLGCQRNVDTWQRVLNVRTLVLEPKENMRTWIKFANLCRKSNRLALAEKSLNMLLDIDEDTGERRAPPQLVYAQLKFMHATNNQHEALRYLVEFAKRMSSDLNLSPDNLIASPLPSEREDMTEEIAEYTKLLARCFLKQGEWQVQLNPNWCKKGALKDSILGSYLLATHFDPQWYKAWHNWAIANFEATKILQGDINAAVDENGAEDDSFGYNESSGDKDSVVREVIEDNSNSSHDLNSINSTENESDGLDSNISDNTVKLVDAKAATIIHVVPAIKGFFHSISLSPKSALQDSLRLITLWFTYGGHSEPARALADGFEMVALEQWLDVVPQLISRIHQTNDIVRETLHGLLTELGQRHPQALVYPLQVSIKSDNEFRKSAATRILDALRLHSPATATLVEQADLVSHELIRVAVLWHEQWHEGLEDASRDYFVEKNITKMFETLEPLHATLAAGATTLREMSFEAAFGRDLFDAYAWGENYKRTLDEKHLNQAWDIYYNVFQRISRQLPQLTSLNLQYVSPKLLNAKDLQLAVPGTYEPNKPVTTITEFEQTFYVISSKQRPRRFVVIGSDGKKYQYVLKGHEDLRQDSLVMQLFGLVNTLLANNDECFKRHLCIQRFPVIPLSPKTGLLGWVPHSDTFHFLIREHREGKSLLNIEHRIMIQMAPDYDSLTHLQKIEVFTYALDNTKGHDLYRILWLKSQSSEAWLNRRTEYTRSLAVMSMVGYILGLGDRHPLNLMLDRITGRVIHIDFGDCFEAAILREKFPEKVPFRLTRMLTYATEVSGVEGSFRITCEHVMALIRDNAESLMAILEAFAYDPLINWGFELPKDLRGGDPNARPRMVLQRIEDKFAGNDFKRRHNLNVADQVDLLIQEATSIENLCQHFIGWCAFW